jgi:hypothetical protein
VVAVFRKKSCSSKKIERDDDSTKSYPALKSIQASNDASWVADSQRIGWNARGDDATSTYRGVMSDVDTRKNDHSRADPHVVLDDDRC